MLKKIYQELLLIRKELQAIRSSMESSSKKTYKYTRLKDGRVVRTPF